MRRPALPVGCIALIFLGRGCATNILATDRAEAVDRVSGVLWRRGSDYATLTFAQDLSSVFTYGNVTLLGSRPAGGPHTPKQGSGMDPGLGPYDELVLGPYTVRYYSRADAFTFGRAYDGAITPQTLRPTPRASSGGAGCADVSGTYTAPPAGGTGPGGVDVISTVSQTGCALTIGGDASCNGATATIFSDGLINGTGRCLAQRTGYFNGTHLVFHGAPWSPISPGFPDFRVAGLDATNLRCVGWEDIAFAPATLEPSLATCQTDGPLVAFLPNPSARPHPTFVFSALDHFTTNVPTAFADGVSVATQGAAIPAGTRMETVLLARPGITRAMRAWGALMRQKYNTTRRRGPATTGLSYWSDNQAGYSFWSVDHELDVWGQPEQIFIDLKRAYASKGIRFLSWETDQNFIGEMCPGCPNDGFGWCWTDVGTWNKTLFPSGMGLSRRLGNLPMVFYISTLCRDNVYRLSSEGGQGGKYRFMNISAWTGSVLNAAVHPDDSHAAYTDMLSPLVEWGNMQMLFTDFLCWRGPEVQRQLPEYFEADHTWLEGMTTAAQTLGLEVQYCMACGHQALDSLRWPAVTNMRANGDGGLDVPTLAYASFLQGALGLGFSKDNLRLSNCSVPPCDGAYSPFGAALQTVLAALSLGPVGLADQLTGHPARGVDVNTNLTLARSLASAAGHLLQPSYPLTPIDPCLAGEEGLSPQSGNVWATYTAVSGAVWWTVVGWGWSGQPVPLTGRSSRRWNGHVRSAETGLPSAPLSAPAPPQTPAPTVARAEYTVLPMHLSPMVDLALSVSGNFSAVPRGSFVGSGVEDAVGLGDCVAWRAGWARAVPFDARGAPVSLEDHIPDQINIAPVINGVAVLGEAGKVAAVSTYRFKSVAAGGPAPEDGAKVEIRGEAKEVVVILYAATSTGHAIAQRTVRIGQGGTATVTLM